MRYWVHEHAISMNEGPFPVEVYFGRGGNLSALQAILDNVS